VQNKTRDTTHREGSAFKIIMFIAPIPRYLQYNIFPSHFVSCCTSTT
jgi:hypothetical protein